MYYLKDKQTKEYLNFKYTNGSSTSLCFEIAEDKEQAISFRYEYNAEKYALKYKEIIGKEADIVDESWKNKNSKYCSFNICYG